MKFKRYLFLRSRTTTVRRLQEPCPNYLRRYNYRRISQTFRYTLAGPVHFSRSTVMKIILLFVCLAVGGIVETIGARQQRSIGGVAISIEQAPFFVSIVRFNLKNRQGIRACGGAFITTECVLTAAHCLYDENNEWYPHTVVISGMDKSDEGGLLHTIDRVFVPNEFTAGSFMHNIVVIKLLKEVEWNNKRQPIPLASAELVHNERATLITFETMLNPRESSVLNRLEVTIQTSSDYLPSYLSTSMFCGAVEDGKSTSSTDSGAPLIYNGTVVGITSWLTPHIGKYRVFTGVFKYVNFIEDAIASFRV